MVVSVRVEIDLWTFSYRIVNVGWAGSSDSMKLYIIDGLTEVDYDTLRPTVLVGTVCEYLDLLFLSIPYLPSSLSPLT